MDSYHSYFTSVFLKSPFADERLPSLVYEDKDGSILGFLGVAPRRFSFKGESLSAAISSQLMVEPSGRSTFVGIYLLRKFLEGPQDFSIADEANDAAKRIWESLGGTTSYLRSLYWFRLLRPCHTALSILRRRRWLSPIALLSQPMALFLDSLLAHAPRSYFRQRPPQASSGDLTPNDLAKCLPSVYGRSIVPMHDEASLAWLFHRADQKKQHGNLHTVRLSGEKEKTVGWYIAYFNPGRVSEVLQIGAAEPYRQLVLDHLFYNAWSKGVIALTGHIDPAFLKEYAASRCFFHHRNEWVLLHSKRPEILQHYGNSLVSRLEGEWCLRFR
jgi:hypothetical protein